MTRKKKALAVMICGFHRGADVWRDALVWKAEDQDAETRELWTFNPLGDTRMAAHEHIDRHFELHPLWVHRAKGRDQYVHWVNSREVFSPEMKVYAQDGPDTIGGAFPFPIDSKAMLALPRGGKYHAGSVDMLVAFALTVHVDHILIRGMNYEYGEPYSARACLEYWCGVAEGRGVSVDVTDSPTMLRNVARFGPGVHDIDTRNPIYGYDVCHLGSLPDTGVFVRTRCPLWRQRSERASFDSGFQYALDELKSSMGDVD